LKTLKSDFTLKNRRAEQVLSGGGGYQWEGTGGGEMVREGEYDPNTVYACL
jgi:hypothetical protein